MPEHVSAPLAESPEEALDHAPCGLLTTTPDGTILTVNQTFLDWTGYSRASLVGVRRLDELFTIPCRIYYETHHAPLLQLQGFVNEIATDVVCSDGRVIPSLLNASEKRDAEGRVVLVRNALFSGTQRRRYERELLLERRSAEQAARAKADFLAMFAHEIRNPLGALVLQVQLLERKGLAAEHRSAVARLHASLGRLLSLVNNMLDISKLEAGRVTLDEVPFDLRDVLNAVAHTLAPSAEHRGIALRVEVDPRVPGRVRSDPVKLEQVLTNLVGNGIKFTERGSVTLGVQWLGTSGESVHLRLWVQDTGIGIAPERQAHVFEPYTQAERTTASRFGGTGLGLSICRKLLEVLGSQLTLQSEPGKGSCFAFELRLHVPPEAGQE